MLRAQRVVRTTGSRADDTIEPYHARMRSAVLAGCRRSARERHHRALATALSGKGTAEQLARHWYGAGEVEHAAAHARRAGDEARASSTSICPRGGTRSRSRARSGPRTSAARCARSSPTRSPMPAVRARPPISSSPRRAAPTQRTALELRRRAAGVAAPVGLHHRGPRADARRARRGRHRRCRGRRCARWSRCCCGARGCACAGSAFTPRELGEISQAELTRVDVCEGVSFGLALVDTFRSMDFRPRFLAVGAAARRAVAGVARARARGRLARGDRAARRARRGARPARTAHADARRPPQAEAQLLTTRGVHRLLRPQPVPRARRALTEAIDRYRAVGRPRRASSSTRCSMFWLLVALLPGRGRRAVAARARRWPRPRCAPATATPR